VLVLAGLAIIGGRVWTIVWPGSSAWGFYFGEWRRWTFAVGLVALGALLIAYSGRASAKLPTRERRLYRSRSDRKVAGVLGGIAQYFDMDPTLVRLAFVVFALVVDAGGALLAYIVAAIIMPEEPLPGQHAPPPPPPPGG
jgi:phage shock protein PspC (stress-responsive transcriptional regulator)